MNVANSIGGGVHGLLGTGWADVFGGALCRAPVVSR